MRFIAYDQNDFLCKYSLCKSSQINDWIYYCESMRLERAILEMYGQWKGTNLIPPMIGDKMGSVVVVDGQWKGTNPRSYTPLTLFVCYLFDSTE